MVRNNDSFTLIEIVLVIFIITLFSGMSLAYYNNYTEEQKLKAETEKIIDVLELVKKKAVSGDLSGQNCTNFLGYQVAFTSNQYSFKLMCEPDCGGTDCDLYENYFSLPTSLSLTSDNGSILFKPLSNGVNISSVNNITVTNNRLSKCKKISVAPNGLIDRVSVCP
ncbi:hypothetical protein GYA28_00530 [Candidatus Roizmanbacteria bacterium]|jgi:Tfp pilus assembly major pilin PilA|nr:hypothetical protein [Candidatus Roizmanbacteria bacterium]